MFDARPAQAWIVRIAGALALAMGATATPVRAQTVLADVRGLSARQVRTEAFTLPSAQEVRIDATGEQGRSDAFPWTRFATSGTRDAPPGGPWAGNAWILDLRSRRVVWEIGGATTTRGRRNTREFAGGVRLPAGSYAAYVAAYPAGAYASDDDGLASRVWKYLGADDVSDYKLVVRGTGQKLSHAEVERLRQESVSQSIVSLRATSSEHLQQAGFALDQPAAIDISAQGETREDGEFDYGWIINADTRATVWRLTWRDSTAAGGAMKNRMARLTRTLPAGRYAAFYATDDSHDPSEWNAPPPADPESWGLTIRVIDPLARATVRGFPYEHVPQNATIVALTRVGNSETRRQGFTLNRAMDVRVYAIGEGRERQMFDYGWITDVESGAHVWDMRYEHTEHGGGDPKNRIADTTLRLAKGSYVVHYVSDSSHSADDWNAAAPADGRRWGITVLSALGPLDRGAIGPLAENPNPAVLAELTEVRDDDQVRKRFTLDRPTAVRVRALGEGSRGGMHDYGWIEDATGRRVWEMTYRQTEHGGGAPKNRRVDATITLPAGEYTVYFETDRSHAFGDWNAGPPDQREDWGIRVMRAAR